MKDILIKSLFCFQGHKFVLYPLTPQHAREDKIKLKTKLDSEKEKQKFEKIKQIVSISSEPLCIFTSPSLERGTSSSIYISFSTFAKFLKIKNKNYKKH